MFITLRVVNTRIEKYKSELKLFTVYKTGKMNQKQYINEYLTHKGFNDD